MKFSISIFLSLITVFLSAQNEPNKDFLISANGQYGYIISHRSNMAHLIKGHIYGGEVNYVFRTDGSKPWHQLHNYPEMGLCYLHMYLANPQQLGNWESLYSFVNFRLNKRKYHISSNLRLGLGLAYLTKCFNPITNHKNTAIGSHLNAFVNLRYNIYYYLSPALRLELGAGLSHASNGATKTPNLGLNIMTCNFGIAYVFGNKQMQFKKDTLPTYKKEWKNALYLVAGIKELMPAGGKKYGAFGLNYTIVKMLNRKNDLGGGIDLFYNTATKRQWEVNDSVYQTSFSDIFQAGAKVAYSFNMHRLSLPVEFGFYTFKKQKENGKFYNRIGLRYAVNKHWMACFTLLTHFAKADYFEYGIGYRF